MKNKLFNKLADNGTRVIVQQVLDTAHSCGALNFIRGNIFKPNLTKREHFVVSFQIGLNISVIVRGGQAGISQQSKSCE